MRGKYESARRSFIQASASEWKRQMKKIDENLKDLPKDFLTYLKRNITWFEKQTLKIWRLHRFLLNLVQKRLRIFKNSSESFHITLEGYASVDQQIRRTLTVFPWFLWSEQKIPYFLISCQKDFTKINDFFLMTNPWEKQSKSRKCQKFHLFWRRKTIK